MLQPAPIDDDPVSDDPVTFAEFCREIRDGQKADLIDGIIYMASPDRLDANDLNMFLVSVLRMYDSARQLGGLVLASRYAMRIDDTNAPEPDVMYVSAAQRHLAEELGFRGAPDVAVEIVSRDSRRRDTEVKRNLYERAGVREYWIIDPRRHWADFFYLSQGRYEALPLAPGDIFVSRVIPGFWLRCEWLLDPPLPDSYTTLQTILAGAPVADS